MALVNNFNYEKLVKTWPKFPPEADKYSRGVVGILTGSPLYPGAALLSVLGALNTGAGFIRFGGTQAAHQAVLTRAPSVVFSNGPVDAWVVGCGWDEAETETNYANWKQVLDSGVPAVIDAGAMRWAVDGSPAGSLMTPHAGELARLLNVTRAEVEANPVDYAIQAARLFRATVLLKGYRQYVATQAGRVTKVDRGVPWTAQAGSGDVLAGMAGTLLAQLKDPALAGLSAAMLQVHAATLSKGPVPPDRMAETLPGCIAGLATAKKR